MFEDQAFKCCTGRGANDSRVFETVTRHDIVNHVSCQHQAFTVDSYQCVFKFRVYGNGKIAWNCPGCGCPDNNTDITAIIVACKCFE